MSQSQSYRWHLPLDPFCPEVMRFNQTMQDDPMIRASGVADELAEDFDRKHMKECRRCQEYGTKNIEVV